MANTTDPTISALEADLRLFLNHMIYRKVDSWGEKSGEPVHLSLSGELDYELAVIVKEGGVAVAIPFHQILELSLVDQFESVRWFRTDAGFEREAFEHSEEYEEYSEGLEDWDPIP